MFKKASFVVGITLLVAAPLISSASTANIATSVSGSVGSPIMGPTLPSCSLANRFTRSLYVGVSGSDVTALQEYLAAQGYFTASPTGYFGPITESAVGRWQAHAGVAAQGSAGNGIFGPLSRSYFSRICNGGTPVAASFSVTPQSGAAPLTVQFVSTAPQGGTVGGSVNFGDGTSGNLLVVPTSSNGNEIATVSHTYTSDGTYTAQLIASSACACPANGMCNCPNMQILNSTTVTVGATTTASNIQQLNAPGSVSLAYGDIAEIRNESFYFTLQNLTASSATIQITPVGCWNSFPSDTPPQIRCMLAMLPIPAQTLSVGQTYTSTNYSITLTQIVNGTAQFSVNAIAVGHSS